MLLAFGAMTDCYYMKRCVNELMISDWLLGRQTVWPWEEMEILLLGLYRMLYYIVSEHLCWLLSYVLQQEQIDWQLKYSSLILCKSMINGIQILIVMTYAKYMPHLGVNPAT